MRTNVGKEIRIDKPIPLVTRTNTHGIIEYSNREFRDLTGFSIDDLRNTHHKILKHPDVPQIIHDLMWDSVRADTGIDVVLKNKTKNGDFFWSLTKIRPIRSQADSSANTTAWFSVIRFPISNKVKKEFENLYTVLLEIERTGGRELSKAYLQSMLFQKQLTFKKYIDIVVGGNRSNFRRFLNLSI